MTRRVARELALKALFARDLGKINPIELLEQLYEEEKAGPTARDFCRYIVEGVVVQQDVIDSIIRDYSIEWDLERLAGVDRNIMRIALYEIFFAPGIPAAVAVNEAVEVAKRYGSEESARFINGILGRVIKDEEILRPRIERRT